VVFIPCGIYSLDTQVKFPYTFFSKKEAFYQKLFEKREIMSLVQKERPNKMTRKKFYFPSPVLNLVIGGRRGKE